MNNNKFIIIVTHYNVVNYIKLCLDSILCQDYENYEVVVMDDASDDGTWNIIKEYPFHAIKNEVRNGWALVNILKAIYYLDLQKEDIIVFLSGDDYFADKAVLSHLNDVYTDDIYMTYGQFIPLSGEYGAYCKPIPDTKTYRQSGQWLASHLITCRKKLWDMIDDKDLRDKNGEYSHHACDNAFMYPMIEMSGKKHLRFIDKVLYIYNDLNPMCISKITPAESIAEAAYFRSKPPYNELP